MAHSAEAAYYDVREIVLSMTRRYKSKEVTRDDLVGTLMTLVGSWDAITRSLLYEWVEELVGEHFAEFWIEEAPDNEK